MVPKIMSKLILTVPFLSWGPLPLILNTILVKLIGFSLRELAIASNALFIKIEIDMDVDGMKKALSEAYINPNPAVSVEELNEDIKDAMRDLIRIGRTRL